MMSSEFKPLKPWQKIRDTCELCGAPAVTIARAGHCGAPAKDQDGNEVYTIDYSAHAGIKACAKHTSEAVDIVFAEREDYDGASGWPLRDSWRFWLFDKRWLGQRLIRWQNRRDERRFEEE